MSSKQREALEQIYTLLSIGGKPDTAMCIRYEAAFQIAKEALSAPPRNCDVYNDTGETMRRYGFPTKSNPWTEADWLKFIDWLFAETQGEAK